MPIDQKCFPPVKMHNTQGVGISKFCFIFRRQTNRRGYLTLMARNNIEVVFLFVLLSYLRYKNTEINM